MGIHRTAQAVGAHFESRTMDHGLEAQAGMTRRLALDRLSEA